ncbi:hypothetical protein V6N11_040412 [Hibiscus sabdariffa]|uniref:RNase H type-1 domain-containing protein n=1 Tax=Hibiscus sabdariffa TaxID=183260 RepID=A0ABR2RHE6_9ROSI
MFMEVWRDVCSSSSTSKVWYFSPFVRWHPTFIELQAVKLGMELFLVPLICFLNLVEEFASIISSQSFLPHWIPRSCNFVTDSLAKAGIG